MIRNLDRMLSAIVANNTQELDDAGIEYEMLVADKDLLYVVIEENGKQTMWPISGLDKQCGRRDGAFRTQHPSERALLEPRAFAVVSGYLSAGIFSIEQFELGLAFGRIVDNGPLTLDSLAPLLDDMLGFANMFDDASVSTASGAVVH